MAEIDIRYMATFFRQIKIRVLTLTSRKSNEKIEIYGGTDFKGASEPAGRQESSRDLSGVRDFRADILKLEEQVWRYDPLGTPACEGTGSGECPPQAYCCRPATVHRYFEGD